MKINVFKALSDPIRRDILLQLREGKHAAGELVAKCNIKDSSLSYHLKMLKEVGLVSEEKYKNFIFYEINTTILDEVILWVNELKGGKDNED